MMSVVRMRRGWRIRLTDNEFKLLREAVNQGLAVIDASKLPYKVRKVLFASDRWLRPYDPLMPDEDRRKLAS
jgi:hypothetical protein